MPLKIGDKTFSGFMEAVQYCMKTKGMTMEQAKRYVGAIQAKQEG